jgi:hypothetical protein
MIEDISDYILKNSEFTYLKVYDIIDDNDFYYTAIIDYKSNGFLIQKSRYAVYKKPFNRFRNLKNLLD